MTYSTLSILFYSWDYNGIAVRSAISSLNYYLDQRDSFDAIDARCVHRLNFIANQQHPTCALDSATVPNLNGYYPDLSK
mgnify:CR=1 FL=1